MMKQILRSLLFSMVLCTLQAETDWPQWMGPGRDGRIQGERWPDKLEGRLQKVWRVELAPSYSTPIVAGTHVYTTETRDKSHEVVRCFEKANGKEVWRTEWEGSLSVPFFAKSNGDWIRSTPAYKDGKLYVAGMRDLLVCLDASNGKEVWRLDFMKELKSPEPDFGFVSSPVIEDGGVFVQAGASVTRVDAVTGKIVWRSMKDAGGMWGSAFSSPVVATLAGERQLVVLSRSKLAGLSLSTGEILWEQPVEAFRGMNILTPVIFENGVFTAAYGGKSHLFDIAKESGKFQVRERWNYKGQGYMSTPVVAADHVWLLQRSQRIVGLNLKTGAERWTTGESYGKYWSQVGNGEEILSLDERGILFLIRATPDQFQLLDQKRVAEKDTWAHLAVSGRDLFVRELKALAMWHWE